MTAHMTKYDTWHLAFSFVQVAILLVAKLPEMHGVRIFHINQARGIED